MNEREHRKLIEYMTNQPGAEHEFVVERTLEATDRDGLGVGMSPEAMETLHQQMITWVGTRVMRFADERGVMPQTVKVVLSVEMEV